MNIAQVVDTCSVWLYLRLLDTLQFSGRLVVELLNKIVAEIDKTNELLLTSVDIFLTCNNSSG